ncbi:M56 family metallopeptidase [Lysobacter antibioticus]|uniref:M56 family metallopeptidase n=1 Tax=Lysobacter antibioticus TaxID=84531 RepID=UPI0004D034BD|nr:M56 family metallopeptidase [Lysobacter antibioticus]
MSLPSMDLSFVADTLLPRLAAASLQSLLLVAAVWALCRYLPRLSASARCWLWWLAALQLLVGLLWPTPLMLPLLPESFGILIADAPSATAMPLSARLPFVMAGGDAPTASLADAAIGSVWPSWTSLLAGIWLLAFSAVLTANLRAFLDTRRRIARSSAEVPLPVAQAYRRLGDSLGLRRLPELRLSAEIESPQLLGPWPAVVLLPQHRIASMSAGELDMALHHELVHLRRRDLWWGWVPALAQQLFFFHPLAHLVAREYSLAREAACDAAVLDSRRYTPQDYGRLLLRLGVAPRPGAGVASASPTYTALKRRLTMLQNAASTSHAGTLALTFAVVLLGLVPYRITAAADASAKASSRTISVQSDRSGGKAGETRIFERHQGQAPSVWAAKGGKFYRVDADERYEEVRDAATLARLQKHMRDMKAAEIDARQAERDAKIAEREALRSAQDAERAGREAERVAQQARRDGEQARLDAAQGANDARQAALDRDQVARDAEQARRDAEQHMRDVEQARRDVQQAIRDAEQAARDAAEYVRWISDGGQSATDA